MASGEPQVIILRFFHDLLIVQYVLESSFTQIYTDSQGICLDEQFYVCACIRWIEDGVQVKLTDS